MQLPIDIHAVKGFLAEDEGRALHDYALRAATQGPCLEIGSYCGKSTVYLGLACQQQNGVLYAVDHHRGSEEHQLGEEYHDAELYDSEYQQMDSFRQFRHTVALAGLDDTVVPIVAPSELAARSWKTPLAMVFIDGGHSEQAAQTDYECWSRWVQPQGILAIHDVFPNPADGGRPPFNIYQRAINSGQFKALEMVNSLALLQRVE